MDFSESYKCSLPPAYSPNGRFCAAAVDYRLIIREVETLRIVQLYSCLDRITQLEWSSNSLYILCSQSQRSLVQIWAVDDPEWSCKIDEGPAGVCRVLWAPDGVSVLALAQFNIRLTVWNLMDRRCTYLRGSKHSDKGMAFSKDGRMLAVLERYDLKDHITVYNVGSWQQVSHFPCDTRDAVNLAWSPDCTCLVVWDSCLANRLQVFSAQGRLLTLYQPGPQPGAQGMGLGIKSCAWNPGGQLLAVGSYDQACRVLDHVTWQPLLEARHPSQLDSPEHVVMYREVHEEGNEALGSTPTKSLPRLHQGRSKYVISALPAPVPCTKPDMAEHQLQLGIGHACWSPDSRFLVTINANQAHSVWVWDMATMELSAVLSHQQAVKDMQWAPQGCSLAVVTGTSKVFMWTPDGASVVFIPLQGFKAQCVMWGPTGTSFMLADQDTFCCAYLNT
ncbi:hypothetical protein V8C86DRAFT_2908902 [Haematococcus lacustris]